MSPSSNSISASSHLKIIKKKVWVFFVSLDFSCFEYYLLDFWAVTVFWDILCSNIFCLDYWVWVGCFCCWFHLLIIIYSLCANLCSELCRLLGYILIRFMGLVLFVIYSICEFGCLKMSAVLVWLTDYYPFRLNSLCLVDSKWFSVFVGIYWFDLVCFCLEYFKSFHTYHDMSHWHMFVLWVMLCFASLELFAKCCLFLSFYQWVHSFEFLVYNCKCCSKLISLWH